MSNREIMTGTLVVGIESLAMRPTHEPLGSVVFQATTRDISTVLIAGKIMKQAGKLNGVDSDRLAAQAKNSAREILERVRKSVRRCRLSRTNDE